MKTFLDIENWPRKEHFHFFRKFEEPFFGATVEIDCTKAHQTAKDLDTSFFIYYLHKTVVAINTITPFKYRILDDQIVIHHQINASATIGRSDDSFGFSLIEYSPDFAVFKENALIEIERVQQTPGLFTRSFETDDVIHFSAIPWVNFTSLSHARSYTFPDSCPKVSFGKMTTNENGKKTMSMSVHVHHGLIDGLHLGQFIDCFQDLMNQ